MSPSSTGSGRSGPSAHTPATDRASFTVGTTSDQTAGAVIAVSSDATTAGISKNAAQADGQTLPETVSILDDRLTKVHRVIIERRIDMNDSVPDEQETH